MKLWALARAVRGFQRYLWRICGSGPYLIKGRGWALTREKLVATAARSFVIIVDKSKLVERFGRGSLPVEVVPFLWEDTARRLRALGTRCELRQRGTPPYVTDNDNLILDLTLEAPIADPVDIAARLKGTLGAVEHGQFIGLTRACMAAGRVFG